jgi:hypothetical protein
MNPYLNRTKCEIESGIKFLLSCPNFSASIMEFCSVKNRHSTTCDQISSDMFR